MEQLAFFPKIDDKTQKTIEKEVIKVLKEYRALKIRMENQKENLSLMIMSCYPIV